MILFDVASCLTIFRGYICNISSALLFATVSRERKLFCVGRRFSPKGRAVHFEQVYSRSGRRLLKLPPRVKLPHRAEHTGPGHPGLAGTRGRGRLSVSWDSPGPGPGTRAHAQISIRDAHQSGVSYNQRKSSLSLISSSNEPSKNNCW